MDNIKSIEMKQKFLDQLTNDDTLGNVSFVCKKLKLVRSTVYLWKKNDKAFSNSWDELMEEADDLLADEAENALLEGIRKGNPTLIIFTLKNRRPERWKDRKAHGGISGDEIPVSHTFEAPGLQEWLDKQIDDRAKAKEDDK